VAIEQMSITDTYNALLTTTLRAYRPKMVDNITRGLPLLWWLTDKGRKRTQDGGHSIVVPLMYGTNSTVKAFEGYDTLDVTPQDGITAAIYYWKNISASITISRDEERKNSGQYKLIDLLETKTMQAEKAMRWYLNDLFHGVYSSHAKTFCGADANTVNSVGDVSGDYIDSEDGSGKGFNSLDHLVRTGWGMTDVESATARTHRVGNIPVSVTSNGVGGSYADWGGTLAVTAYTNAWWMNYSNPGFNRIQRGADGGVMGSLLDFAEMDAAADADGNTNQNIITAMRSMYNRLVDGSDKPSLGLTGQRPYELYEAALVPLERFTDTRVGDAGFQNLKFKGLTLIFDHGLSTPFPAGDPSASAPAIPLYMLDTDYLEWVVDSESDFETSPFYRPHNQAARTAQIFLTAQLCTSNRSRHGVISLCLAANYTP